MSDHVLRDLRRELGALERGRGKRYPADVRRRVAGWARRALEEGGSLGACARALALRSETLRAWLADARTASMALVPVEIIAEPPAPTRGIRLVSPAGFRIEWLALDEVAALLRVLG